MTDSERLIEMHWLGSDRESLMIGWVTLDNAARLERGEQARFERVERWSKARLAHERRCAEDILALRRQRLDQLVSDHPELKSWPRTRPGDLGTAA